MPAGEVPRRVSTDCHISESLTIEPPHFKHCVEHYSHPEGRLAEKCMHSSTGWARRTSPASLEPPQPCKEFLAELQVEAYQFFFRRMFDLPSP